MTATHSDHLELTNRGMSTAPPLGEHASGPPITDFLSGAGQEQWEATSRRVQAILRGRGVDADAAQDVLQEVALKLLAEPPRFNNAAHRERWVAVVAWRLAQNRWRDDQRLVFRDPPEVAGGKDPAEVVEARETLHRVLDGLRQLPIRDREAIRLGLEPGRQEGAIVVRRHRARAQLARFRVGIGVAAIRARWRLCGVREAIAPAVVGGALLLGPTGGLEPSPEGGRQRPPTSFSAARPATAASGSVDGTLAPGRDHMAGTRPAPVRPDAGAQEGAGVRRTRLAVPGASAAFEIRPAEPERRPPLLCALRICQPHPAPGILTP